MGRRRWRFIGLGVAALFVIGVGAAAAGAAVEDKLRTGDTVTVEAGEVVGHDLYVTGGDVIVDGTISGDLVVASGSVMINGTVEGDLVAGTGRLIISGEVGGDARIGAGWVTLSGVIGEDLLAGAGQIEITDGAEVGEGLVFGAGDVLVDGDVLGSVYGGAQTYERNGTVGGTERVTLGAPTSPGEPGEPEPAPPSDPVRPAGDALRQLVTVVLFGALGMWRFPRVVRASEGALRRRPLASVGMGIGVLVGYVIQFIAVILLMILLAIAFGSVTLDALVGITVWAGILELLVTTFALVVAASFLVDAVVGLALAQLVARGWAKNRWQELALFIGGSAVVVAVTSLPGIGFPAKLVVIVLGLGAMSVAASEAWQRRHPPAEPTFGAGTAAAPPAPLPPDPATTA